LRALKQQRKTLVLNLIPNDTLFNLVRFRDSEISGFLDGELELSEEVLKAKIQEYAHLDRELNEALKDRNLKRNEMLGWRYLNKQKNYGLEKVVELTAEENFYQEHAPIIDWPELDFLFSGGLQEPHERRRAKSLHKIVSKFRKEADVTSYINEKNPPIKVIEGLKTEWEKKKVDPKKYNATIPKLF